MANPAQIRAARAMLDITQAELSKLAGVSLPRIVAVEHGGACLQSTATAIIDALERKGAVFGRDGSCKIIPEAERFVTGPWGDHDPEKQRLALKIINAGRLRDSLPPLVGEPEDDAK
jgi:DNA-binding XRE family transcriptional regulator